MSAKVANPDEDSDIVPLSSAIPRAQGAGKPGAAHERRVVKILFVEDDPFFVKLLQTTLAGVPDAALWAAITGALALIPFIIKEARAAIGGGCVCGAANSFHQVR